MSSVLALVPAIINLISEVACSLIAIEQRDLHAAGQVLPPVSDKLE
jgi:hypothetical protein